MNRHDRRKAARQNRGSKPMGFKRAVLADIERNGITAENLSMAEDRAFQLGRVEGLREGGEPMIKLLYASMCLSLHRLHGFGAKRCKAVLHDMEAHMLDELATDEAVEQVEKVMGYTMNFRDPFDRVQEVEEA